MKIEMRAPRGGDIRTKVKKFTLTADDDREDEMGFLTDLNNVFMDGGVIVVYAKEVLIGNNPNDISGKIEPTKVWRTGV